MRTRRRVRPLHGAPAAAGEPSARFALGKGRGVYRVGPRVQRAVLPARNPRAPKADPGAEVDASPDADHTAHALRRRRFGPRVGPGQARGATGVERGVALGGSRRARADPGAPGAGARGSRDQRPSRCGRRRGAHRRLRLRRRRRTSAVLFGTARPRVANARSARTRGPCPCAGVPRSAARRSAPRRTSTARSMPAAGARCAPRAQQSPVARWFSRRASSL